MRDRRNIILTGFMGSGKTTVGRLLARRLGWRFTDLDRSIERRAGASVAAVFRDRGEAAFRDLEHRALRDLERTSRRVVAVGGGAPVFPRNRRWLRAAGLVVYLKVSPAELARRLGRARGRPLLASARGSRSALLALVRRLLRRRESAYALADLTVRAGAPSPARVAAAIARRMRPESASR